MFVKCPAPNTLIIRFVGVRASHTSKFLEVHLKVYNFVFQISQTINKSLTKTTKDIVEINLSLQNRLSWGVFYHAFS